MLRNKCLLLNYQQPRNQLLLRGCLGRTAWTSHITSTKNTFITTRNDCRSSVATTLLPLLTISTRTQVWCFEPPSKTWMCASGTCLTTNVQNSRKCTKCGSKKPSIISVPFGNWQCSSCNTSNPKNLKFCKDCATAFSWPKNWKCPSCQNVNPVEAEPKGGYANFNPYAPIHPSKATPTSPQCSFCEWTARPKSAIAAAAAATNTPQQHPQQQKMVDESSEPHFSTGLELLNDQSNPNTTVTDHGGSNFDSHHPSINNQNEEQQQPPVTPQPRDEDDDLPPADSMGPPGFPWLCRNKSCGAENPGTNASCRNCGWNIWPSDWMCSGCGASNFKMRSQCFNCMSPIQPYWHCKECRKNTSIYQKRCRGCNADRPEPSGKGVNISSNNRGAASSSGSGGGGGKAGSGQGDWVCAVCHKFNYARRTSCFSCETPRGGTADGQPTLSEITPVGDSNWRCHICQALNFRSRGDCWQCQTTKQQNFASSGVLSSSAAASAGTPGENVHQIEEGEDTAPIIEREGFQEDRKLTRMRQQAMMEHEQMMMMNNNNDYSGDRETNQQQFDEYSTQESSASSSTKSISELEDQRKLERRRKALEHAAGWSGTAGSGFNHHNRGGIFHPPGSTSIGGDSNDPTTDFVDDGHDWLCAKCMRKNLAGSTECARCFTPKTVAPGSRALTALNAEKKKKIFKL